MPTVKLGDWQDMQRRRALQEKLAQKENALEAQREALEAQRERNYEANIRSLARKDHPDPFSLKATSPLTAAWLKRDIS